MLGIDTGSLVVVVGKSIDSLVLVGIIIGLLVVVVVGIGIG